MPVFTATGTRAKDLWLVDGSPTFAVFPGGILPDAPEPLPIWLRVGTAAYGQVHIDKRHGRWVGTQGMSVPELVYHRLGQSGLIYCTEETAKFKISLQLTPKALLVLNLISRQEDEPHFSVTSLYLHPARIDGYRLGRYPGRPGAGQTRRMF